MPVSGTAADRTDEPGCVVAQEAQRLERRGISRVPAENRHLHSPWRFRMPAFAYVSLSY